MKKTVICILSLLLTANISAQVIDYTKPDSLKVMSLFKKAKTLKDKSMSSYMVFSDVNSRVCHTWQRRWRRMPTRSSSSTFTSSTAPLTWKPYWHFQGPWHSTSQHSQAIART